MWHSAVAMSTVRKTFQKKSIWKCAKYSKELDGQALALPLSRNAKLAGGFRSDFKFLKKYVGSKRHPQNFF